MKMNKKGIGFLAFLFNPTFLIILIIVIALILIVAKFMYVPEHCIAYSEEVKQALSVKFIEISKIEKSNNQICFRTKDMAVVEQIYQISKDVELKKLIEIETTRRFTINKILDSNIPYWIIVAITLIVVVAILSRKK